MTTRSRATTVAFVAITTVCALAGGFGGSVFPGVADALERVSYDLFYRALRVSPPVDDRLVFVTIDDRSVAEIGSHPFPRGHHARLLDGLRKAGAAGAAWDMIFTQPENDDAAFATAMRALPTVLAFGAVPAAPGVPGRQGTGATDLRRFAVGAALNTEDWRVPAAVAIAPSQRTLVDAAAGVGHVIASVDDDGICRAVPLVVRVDGQLVPSLGLAITMRVLGIERDDVVQDGRWIVLGAGSKKPTRIPVDAAGRLLVNFVSDWTQFDTRSYSSLLQSLEEFPEDLAEGLRGRTVLVGSTMSGSGDFVAVPHSASIPGPLVSLNVANTILTGRYLRELPRGWMMAIGMLAPLFIGLAFASGRPALPAVVTAGVLALLLLGAATAFRWSATFVPVALPLLAAVATSAGLATVSLFAEQARATRIAALLSRFVSPALLRELDAQGTDALPAASRRELTILFVDLAGFTKFTEEREPEEVSALLDRFYALAMEELFREKGTLDEFKGDGVLAYFGAPEPLADKEERAVRAAIAIRDRFGELDRERVARGGEPLGIRCGLTTGHVAVGYFGGHQYATYGVVGRAVNLAARLQGHAALGEVIVDRPTAARLGPSITTTELEPIQVKGVAKPVAIWRIG